MGRMSASGERGGAAGAERQVIPLDPVVPGAVEFRFGVDVVQIDHHHQDAGFISAGLRKFWSSTANASFDCI